MLQSNSWKEIWNGKKTEELILSEDEFEMFCTLKKLDGFDVAVKNEKSYFRGFYHDWNKMYDTMADLISSYNSVYEVGCGGGKFVYV